MRILEGGERGGEECWEGNGVMGGAGRIDHARTILHEKGLGQHMWVCLCLVDRVQCGLLLDLYVIAGV